MAVLTTSMISEIDFEASSFAGIGKSTKFGLHV